MCDVGELNFVHSIAISVAEKDDGQFRIRLVEIHNLCVAPLSLTLFLGKSTEFFRNPPQGEQNQFVGGHVLTLLDSVLNPRWECIRTHAYVPDVFSAHL